jgi:hypothetical protein
MSKASSSSAKQNRAYVSVPSRTPSIGKRSRGPTEEPNPTSKRKNNRITVPSDSEDEPEPLEGGGLERMEVVEPEAEEAEEPAAKRTKVISMDSSDEEESMQSAVEDMEMSDDDYLENAEDDDVLDRILATQTPTIPHTARKMPAKEFIEANGVRVSVISTPDGKKPPQALTNYPGELYKGMQLVVKQAWSKDQASVAVSVYGIPDPSKSNIKEKTLKGVAAFLGLKSIHVVEPLPVPQVKGEDKPCPPMALFIGQLKPEHVT